MNNFNWLKAVGFGALIWSIMFILASVLVGFGVTIGTGWSLALGAATGVVAFLFAINSKPSNLGQALGYGAVWVAMGMVLDLIISQQFVSGLFSMWSYYVGYALVLFAPSVELGLNESPSTRAI